MAFAPISVYYGHDGSIIGQFRLPMCGGAALFEFSENNTGLYPEYPHLIWVTEPSDIDQGFRFGKVIKTRAKVLVDEVVVETWKITARREYDNTGV